MLHAGKQNQTTNKRAEGECVRLCACLSLDHYVEYDFFGRVGSWSCLILHANKEQVNEFEAFCVCFCRDLCCTFIKGGGRFAGWVDLRATGSSVPTNAGLRVCVCVCVCV